MTDLPIGGTTGLDHERTAAIDEAARWLASSSPAERNRPVVVLLRERFGLSAQEACQAIRDCNLIRARAA